MEKIGPILARIISSAVFESQGDIADFNCPAVEYLDRDPKMNTRTVWNNEEERT